MEKRFAYKFLKKLLKYVDSAQEFISHLGMEASGGTLVRDVRKTEPKRVPTAEAMAASGKTDRSPHEKEIKFFAKVGGSR